MITLKEYSGKKIGVFGLGKAGEATVDALLASGAQVYAWDDSEASRKRLGDKLGNKITLQAPDAWPWKDMEALVLSPGVPLTHPKPHAAVELAKQHKKPVIGDIELLWRACPDARYVAITGTNGKSTTTTLIGHILGTCGVKAETGGNLGTPALSLAPLGKDGVYVLETSSYQLDLIERVRFGVAVWLNITADHIDRHGSIDGYILAKLRVFAHQQPSDTAVIAVDDEYSHAAAEALMRARKQKVICVSAKSPLPKGISAEDGVLHDEAAKFTFDLKPIATLTGRHNWQNAAAAYAASKALGLAPDAICKAMQSFAGLRHRLQLVTTIKGVRFINDSKATNADATSNALAPYDTIYWIAGGKPKEGGIAPLAQYFPKIAHAFLIGEAADEFAKTLQGKVSATQCGTLKAAVEKAAAMAFSEGKKDAVVLLSPACASFDQWKNFEERGDAFCDMVGELAAKGAEHAA